jgi:uncharacterized membrane protein YfcA
MLEVLKILIGIGVLIIGIFIGKILAKYTEEELKAGRPWFKAIAILGSIGGIVGLIIQNDVVLFTFFFIALVTSQSIKKKKIGKKSKKK